MTVKDLPQYEHDGRSLTILEWATVTGIRSYDISMRLRQGWTFARIISEVKPATESQPIIIPDCLRDEPVSEPRVAVERTLPVAPRASEEPVFVGYRVAAPLYAWRGKIRSRGEWARRIGITDAAMRERLKEGWSLLRAFTQPLQPHTVQTYSHDGLELTLHEWAKQTGITYTALAHRIRSGLTIGDAIARGKFQRGRRHRVGAQPDGAMSPLPGGGVATSHPQREPAIGPQREIAPKQAFSRS